MTFAEDTRTYSETAKRTAANYVRFSSDYRAVLRILNPKASLVWKHWIAEANGGRGLAANCPNTSPSTKICPVDQQIEHLPKDSEERKERYARKRYIVNVLDRTPYTVCDSCNTQTPGKSCQNCGASLKGHTFAPLNRVKLLEGGPRLFLETLNAVDQMQKEESGLQITDYDITFQTVGSGRDRKIAAIPGAASEIDESEFTDPETGEPQKLFDLDLLIQPNSPEEINLFLQGKGMAEVNELNGVA